MFDSSARSADPDVPALVATLREFYGALARPPATLFQFIVWEILSEHAVIARRDLAWSALKRLPALTPDALYRAPVNDLGAAVALTGLPRDETTDRLRTTAEAFRRHRDTLDREAGESRLLSAWRRLAVLAHLDSRVRRRAMLFALDFCVLPVDEGMSRVVHRLTERLDVESPPAVNARMTGIPAARREARSWLLRGLPPENDAYRETVMYLRHHAQHTCLAAGPHCPVCPLTRRCQSSPHANSARRRGV